MRKRVALNFAVALALSSGCAASIDRGLLESPSTAPIVRSVGEAAGVRFEIRPDIEHPGEFNQSAMPLYVVVSNDSGRDLLVQPDAFALVTPDGGSQTAIRPDVLRRSTQTSIGTDIAVSLRALPTGILQNGGQTKGFLYFPPLPTELSIGVRFELHAQHDGAQFGLIAIPLTPSVEGT
jgi:hypothetical protein